MANLPEQEINLTEKETKLAEQALSGLEKAAVMMLSLSEEIVVQIFSLMSEDEIKELSAAMAKLGTIPAVDVEKIYLTFTKQILSSTNLIGSLESTERLLHKTLTPDLAERIMEEIRGPAGRTFWEKLNNVNEELLAGFLKNEYPQTVALVLTKVKTSTSAKILSLLPESFSIEVVLRMMKMESVRKEILDSVEDTLKQEFMNNLARGTRRDMHETIAEIFNNFDRTNEVRFLKLLEEKNPEYAESIRSLMFTFDDLLRLDNVSIQTLIRNIDKSKLALALKGSAAAMKELFLANMSERAAKLMEEDITNMGLVRLRDVEEAQSNVVETAKDLAAQNVIYISKDKDGGDQLIG